MPTLDQLNEALRSGAPALWSALTPLGRTALYPPDIPFQAAQARGRRYNGTIGQITDGAGRILALPALEELLRGLGDDARNRALLYSPIDGLPELRERWARWQEPAELGEGVCSRPVVTAGLTHALALVADLFGGPGRRVVVPAPFWGNYRQTFGLRTGAEVRGVPAYDERLRWRPGAFREGLEDLPADEPALVVLNLPSNPGGYMPDADERRELLEHLETAAEERPLVVLCDDAYAGLVYDDSPPGSLFWDLLDRHPRLVPLRASGATKEFVLFGGRVGFLTLPFAPESAVTEALENKLRCLIRAGVGSPVATSQVLLLESLRQDGVEEQVAAVRAEMARRWRALRAALAEALEDTETLRALPSNAGAFALLELAPGLDAEAVRRVLLDELDTGVVAVGERHLRIAFCSVAVDDLAPLVERVVRGAERVDERRSGSGD